MRHLIASIALASPLLASPPLEIRFDQPPSGKSKGGSTNFMADAASFPSSNWESQAQPVGNGRLGAMIFGNPWRERIQFNDSSLWTGGANESGGYEVDEFGAYQNFGDVLIELTGAETEGLTDFSRKLDLATGIHTTTWKKDSVTYTREVFASKPDEAIIIRLSADQPARITGKVRLAGAHKETTVAAVDTLRISGSLANGLRHAAQLTAVSEGGPATAGGDSISFSGNAVTLVLTAATDYALDPNKGFRSGKDPAVTVADQSENAATQSYDKLRTSHVADFTTLMGRVTLDVGNPPDKPVNQRLDEYKKGAADPHLEMLMFQYGRYLLASSSRGFLPANLQGLWNDSNKPAWYADYHTNINIQMNYWLAEPSNLAECARPLFDWTVAMIPGSREATVKEFGDKTRGWTMRTSVNIYGGNGWKWNLPASAWLARHFWDHYAFTGDKKFLRDQAWPVLYEISQFWLDHLIEKDGKLLVPQGWSPEHGPREDGVAHDQQIVWDLFTNTLDAASVLREKSATLGAIEAARTKLLGPQVGSWGQIMEWTTERPELEKSGHRHTSHLYALHPGNQITLHGTPGLAKAAAISLESRGTSGDSRRSWTWPWRTAMWARLGRPDKAGEMIRGLLVHNTLPNLFTTHPPFQIDGNLGITAGVCETLVQSHAGEISILPSVFPQWKDGSVTGLLARGGFEVSATWKDGAIQSAALTSKLGKPAVVRLQGNPSSVTVSETGGTTTKINAAEDGTFRFDTKKGATYQLTK